MNIRQITLYKVICKRGRVDLSLLVFKLYYLSLNKWLLEIHFPRTAHVR